MHYALCTMRNPQLTPYTPMVSAEAVIQLLTFIAFIAQFPVHIAYTLTYVHALTLTLKVRDKLLSKVKQRAHSVYMHNLHMCIIMYRYVLCA
jgi:hypothetical protein